MKNRILFISIIALCFVSGVKAQFVVTDPLNMVQNIINSISEIVETSTTATNTIKTFKETAKVFEQGKEYYDKLKSVHNLVKDAKKVQETVLLVGEISDIYVTNYQRILNDPNFSSSEVTAIGNGYTILLNESKDMLSELKDIISDTGLSMTDAERMAIIDKVYLRVKRHRDLVSYYTRKNVSISYLRSRKNGDINRVLALYGNSNDRYW
jgi:DNA mismatch repair ATPase MutS